MPNELNQLNIADALELKNMQKMEKCHHDFMIVKDFDFENDRIYESLVCRKCNYSD